MSCPATAEKKWKALCGQESLGRFMKEHLEGWMGKVGRAFQMGNSSCKNIEYDLS